MTRVRDETESVFSAVIYSGDKEGLMPTNVSPDVKQLIDRANFAHLATLRSDGSPQSVPV